MDRDLQKKLIKSKIVLFLGAGFSNLVEYPIMNKFMKILEKDLNTEEKSIIEIIKILKNTEDLEEIFGQLEEIINIGYIVNFNEFIATKNKLDATLSPVSASTNTSNYSAVLRGVLRKEKEEIYICKKLFSKIKKKLFEVYRPKIDINYLNNYGNFFNTLIELSEKSNQKIFIPIFTTNYDVVIEKYFETLDNKNIEIINFFNNKNNFDQTILKNKRLIKKINILIMHLHGSIFFYKDKDEDLVKNLEISEYLESNRYENQIIYPLKDKTPREEPFFTYYDLLARCLDYTEYAIFLGYSFRDFESLVRIKSALIFNKKIKILIVDQNADELKKYYFNNSKKVITLNQYFIKEIFNKDIPQKIKEIIT